MSEKQKEDTVFWCPTCMFPAEVTKEDELFNLARAQERIIAS